MGGLNLDLKIVGLLLKGHHKKDPINGNRHIFTGSPKRGRASLSSGGEGPFAPSAAAEPQAPAVRNRGLEVRAQFFL